MKDEKERDACAQCWSPQLEIHSILPCKMHFSSDIFLCISVLITYFLWFFNLNLELYIKASPRNFEKSFKKEKGYLLQFLRKVPEYSESRRSF